MCWGDLKMGLVCLRVAGRESSGNFWKTVGEEKWMGIRGLSSSQILVFWPVIYLKMWAQVYGHSLGTPRATKFVFYGTECVLLISGQPSPTREEEKQNTTFQPHPNPTGFLPSFLLLAPLKNYFLLHQAHYLSQHCKSFILYPSQLRGPSPKILRREVL